MSSWPAGAVTAALVVLAVPYVVGYLTLSRLARRHGHPRTVRRGRLFATVTAWTIAVVVLSGRWEAVAGGSFTATTVSQLALMVAVPPLVLAGAPWMALVRGVPARLRSRGRSLTITRLAVAVVAVADRPWLAWLAVTTSLWLAYLPGPYATAAGNPAARTAVQLATLVSGVWWWSTVMDSPPHHARLDAVRMILPQLAIMLNGWILATWLMYTSQLVDHPALAAGGLLWGMGPLDDQRFGASLIWTLGTLPYGAAIAPRAYRWLASDDHDWRLERHAFASWKDREPRRLQAGPTP